MRKPFALIAPAVAVGLGLGVWYADLFPSPAEAETPSYFSSAFPPNEDFQFEPPVPGSYTLNKIKPAPEGRVINIHGEAKQLSQITKGKISLVSFVYLTCGDVNGCPLAMSTLFDIHETSAQIPGLDDDVQLITISFDPERDTAEAIEAFAYPITSDPQADKKLHWEVLTTANETDLAPILSGYGQVVDRSPDSETISHLLRMFLVDREGNIRNIYGLGLIDPRLLMTDVETLMMQESDS